MTLNLRDLSNSGSYGDATKTLRRHGKIKLTKQEMLDRLSDQFEELAEQLSGLADDLSQFTLED